MRLSWPMPRRTSLMSAAMPFAQIGHLVDEADLGGQQRVGHVLGHFGAFGRHDQKRLLDSQETGRTTPQRFHGRGVAHADHDAVGPHEVVDRGPFFEKLGVAHHVEVAAGQFLQPAEVCAFVPTGTVLLVTTMAPSGSSGAKASITAQRFVRSAEPSVGRRRAHGQENELRRLDGGGQIGGEVQPPNSALRRPTRPARLVNRHRSLLERFDLACVHVDAGDFVAGLGEASAGDKADISGTDDGDLHSLLLSSSHRGVSRESAQARKLVAILIRHPSKHSYGMVFSLFSPAYFRLYVSYDRIQAQITARGRVSERARRSGFPWNDRLNRHKVPTWAAAKVVEPGWPADYRRRSKSQKRSSDG